MVYKNDGAPPLSSMPQTNFSPGLVIDFGWDVSECDILHNQPKI